MTSRRSKFDDVRAKLLRFQRDYFCIRSPLTHSDNASRRCRPGEGLDEVAGPQLPSLISASDVVVEHRLSCDAGRLHEMSDGHAVRSSPGCSLRRPHRHSVPSRCCVSILESLDEEEQYSDSSELLATPDWLEYRRGTTTSVDADEFHGVTSSSFDHSSSADLGQDDYQEFVRGLHQSTRLSVTPCSVPPSHGGTDVPDMSGQTVCRSAGGRATSASQGALTPRCCVARTTSVKGERRRSVGGKLLRTLRKTFSLGRNSDLPEDCGNYGLTCDAELTSTASVENLFESVQTTAHWLQQQTVSHI